MKPLPFLTILTQDQLKMYQRQKCKICNPETTRIKHREVPRDIEAMTFE